MHEFVFSIFYCSAFDASKDKQMLGAPKNKYGKSHGLQSSSLHFFSERVITVWNELSFSTDLAQLFVLKIIF